MAIDIEKVREAITHEEYLHPVCAPHVTICVLRHKSGFVTVGESAPVDPAEYDAQLGMTAAHGRAFGKQVEAEAARMLGDKHRDEILKTVD